MDAIEAKTISVITPVYNRADCVEACLRSVACQEVPQGWSVEHVVTDDGSVDASAEIVRAFAAEHPAVHLEVLPHNRGTNAARNNAIARASGRWIMLLDSDDEMLPDAIAAVVRTIEANPDIRHFLFATDDTASMRMDLGAEHFFSFEDFLLERVGGDFAHVLERRTMLMLPFREDIRIFEGVFFFYYYREAGTILYSADVIFHRNRQRADHVTYTLGMTNDKALRNKLTSRQLFVDLYGEDYRSSEEGRLKLAEHLYTIHQLATLIDDRSLICWSRSLLHELGRKAPIAEQAIASLHAGYPLWCVIKGAVRLRRVFQKKGS